MNRIENLKSIIQYLMADEHVSHQIPSSLEERQRMMRALMNVWEPKAISEDFVKMQDAELQMQREDKGVVEVHDEGLTIWQGDITRLKVDAIVNAANSQMLGCFVPLHRCIDNAIHSAAGVQLRLACAEMMHGTEEPTGSARMTPGFNLPIKYVIHTVGPIVTTSRPLRQQEVQLASCYSSCLDLANRHGLESIAFCCISTGEFRFPNDRACDIAVSTVRSWMASHPESSVKTVIFNTFKDIDHELYQNALAKG